MKPARHRRRRETDVAGRRREEENFLPCGKHTRAQQIRKQFRQPRTAGEYVLRRGNGVAGRRADRCIGDTRRRDAGDAVIQSLLYAFGDQRLNCASRHQRAAVALPKSPRQFFRRDLRKTLRQFVRRQPLMCNADTSQRFLRIADVTVIAAREPQHSARMENGLRATRIEFFPDAQRSHRPARVQLIRAITHADDARFASRTGATVRGAECVEQDDRIAGIQQRTCRPRTEATGTDNREVERWLHARVDFPDPQRRHRTEVRSMLRRLGRALHPFCKPSRGSS